MRFFDGKFLRYADKHMAGQYAQGLNTNYYYCPRLGLTEVKTMSRSARLPMGR